MADNRAMTKPLNTLTATELLARGDLRCVDVVRACLERIREREPVLHAWAHIDAAQALAQAEGRDAQAARGQLHGVPVAIKDVIDTADQPTQMGSPIYAGHQPRTDAAVVALLRAAGAVILGKTVTAEFAGMAPSITANPNNPAHTPGGSSSGSAAAVADHMVPLALGTQTGGSVLRPASYCGVIGFKPTYGRVNRAGLKFAAEGLDTIGWMARSLPDIALLDSVLTASPHQPLVSRRPARLGLCRTFLWDQAQPETRAALEDAVAALRTAGMSVETFDLPADWSRLARDREVINDYERSRALAPEWAQHRERISPQLSRSVSRGWEIPQERYVDAVRFVEQCRLRLDELLHGFDAVLAPCVNGEAPLGLGYAGDPGFQALWTLLHVPAVALPTHRGPNGLPVSVQLVAARHSDAGLLASALAVLNILRPGAAD
jgi:Asp-tRNA(Asn)/Glu-tRNA(Gln) amidotransferase A subunit family amidase